MPNPHLEWEAFDTGHTCQCATAGTHKDHVCVHCGLVVPENQFEEMRRRFVPLTDEQHDQMVSKYGGRS